MHAKPGKEFGCLSPEARITPLQIVQHPGNNGIEVCTDLD
jgi:hypothetical protein